MNLARRCWGEAALAAFGLCGVSGVLLASGYDSADARSSIARWLLAAPGMVLLRNVHALSALLFVVCAGGYAIRRVRARRAEPVRWREWRLLFAGTLVAGGLLLSGYLLRGDAPAQHMRVGLETLALGTAAGDMLVAAVLGARDGSLNVVLFHHAATATFLTAFLILRHAGRLWTNAAWYAAAAAVLVLLGSEIAPGLESGTNFGARGTNVAAAVPRPGLWRVGWFRASDVRGIRAEIPSVGGRPEGCLVCHASVGGLGKSHAPETIGCASCHGGDAFSLRADRAHGGLIRIPGNLGDAPRTCGQPGCHDMIAPRVEHSLMTTMAGVVAVDRAAFGEPAAPDQPPPHVRDLGTSAADTHLRQLCASCHLGESKDSWGPNTASTRGGGCNACHIAYDAAAERQLAEYERAGARRANLAHAARASGATRQPRVASELATYKDRGRAVPTQHPSLSIQIGNDACFGCHSRSGRISTNYEGWHELRDTPVDPSPAKYRQFGDDRWFVRTTPDVHQERGLGCTDCHSATEVMGRGATLARKHQQVETRCEDCHARQFPVVQPGDADPETQTLLRLRNVRLTGKALATNRLGEPLANVLVGVDGQAELLRKNDGVRMALRPPAPTCAAGPAHERLSCSSCHTAWAPRCVSCHTTYDRAAEGYDHLAGRFVKGAWQEEGGAFEATPPTLGVRLEPGAAPRGGVVEPFVPGMIMTLDRNRDSGRPPDLVFRRLYARAAPHTTRREARSCESCHNDPIALGFGRGDLRYVSDGASGAWRFTPVHERLADGLPADAWTGFLQTRERMVSTRADVRPFTAEEQRRILQVGACLTCHGGSTPVMQRALADFAGTLVRRPATCVAP